MGGAADVAGVALARDGTGRGAGVGGAVVAGLVVRMFDEINHRP
ncbi:MAG TPA: hypothetical protein VKB02_11050 [Pyrinomonadaceae bacterium]|nr:hypothetical protein [Pyrinomonadaceae bacterium]